MRPLYFLLAFIVAAVVTPEATAQQASGTYGHVEVIAPRDGDLEFQYGTGWKYGQTPYPDDILLRVLKNGEAFVADTVLSHEWDVSSTTLAPCPAQSAFVDRVDYASTDSVTVGEVAAGDTLTFFFETDDAVYGDDLFEGALTVVDVEDPARWNLLMGAYDTFCGVQIEKLELFVQIAGIDLAVDSNNDGVVDGDDDLTEFTDERIGALLPYNDDDDDDNGVFDFEDAGGFFDDELEPITIQGSAADGSRLTLEALEGSDNVRLWSDASKTEAIVLPREVQPSQLPITYFAEGVVWDSLRTVFRVVQEIDRGSGYEEVSADTVQLYSGVLGFDFVEEVEAGMDPVAVVTGLPLGAEVEFSFQLPNSGSLDITDTVSGSAAVAEVDASSAATAIGQFIMGVAYADDSELDLGSVSALIVPGPPDAITWVGSQTVTAVADGHDTQLVEVEVKDAYGNPVETGTLVDFLVREQAGGEDGELSSATDANGKASAYIPAPLTGTAEVMAWAGTDTSSVRQLDFIPVTGALTVNPSTSGTEPYLSEVLTATLTTNASDGTDVFWLVSNVAEGGQAVWETEVQGGTSAIDLSAVGAVTGLVAVTATVGGNAFTAEATFTAEKSNIQVKRPVLAGDITQDGLHTYSEYFPRPPGFTDADGPDPFLVEATAFVPATSEVVLEGAAAETTYQVYFEDPSHGTYLDVLDSGGAPITEITTDVNGRAYFQIQSTGAFLPPPLDDPYADPTLEVELVVRLPPVATRGEGAQRGSGNTAAPLPPDPVPPPGGWRALIQITGADEYARRALIVAGLVDPETGQEFVLAVAGGLIGIGDAGALAKNAWRAMEFSDVPPNVVEVLFSGVGLLTSFVPLADGAVSAMRALASFKPGSKLLGVVYDIVRRTLRACGAASRPALRMEGEIASLTLLEGPEAAASPQLVAQPQEQGRAGACSLPDGFERALINFGTKPRFIDYMVSTTTDATTFRLLTAQMARFGQEFEPKLVEGLSRMVDEGFEVTAKQGVLTTLKGLPDEYLTEIKQASNGAELVFKLGRILEKTNIDAAKLAKAIRNDNIYTKPNVVSDYSLTQFIDDLDIVGERIFDSALDDAGLKAAQKHFNGVMGQLGGGSSNVHGFRYEVESAAEILRAPLGQYPFAQNAPFMLSFRRPRAGNRTDIDIRFGDTFVQVKSSAAAFSGGIAQNVDLWVNRAMQHGAGEIAYVIPPNSLSDKQLPELLKVLTKLSDRLGFVNREVFEVAFR